MVGAFKGVDGGWTLENVRLLFHEPYIDALQDEHRDQPRHRARSAARSGS